MIMRLQTTGFLRLAGVGSVCAGAVMSLSHAADEPPDFLQYDPAQVVGNEAQNCAVCHREETKAWMQSAHRKTFEENHLTRQAKAIADRLGMRTVQNNAECALCHYTETMDYHRNSGTRNAIGVSCQRCHGPAMDWYMVHDRMGIANEPAELEQRGMRHRFSLYELYATCYQCHTVPRERLVNEGRHQPGTLTFELVAWAEGEVRHHNFRFHNRHGNEPASLEHRRFLYVLGKMLDLEYGLRALALADESGRYVRAQRDRVQLAIDALNAPGLAIPEVKAIADIGESLLNGESPYAGLPIEGSDEYLNCARKIADVAHQFEEKRAEYAEELAKVDPFLPGEYRGTVYQPPANE